MQLQQQIASSNIAAITPLKKTPPHFICASEELANLSPAKPYKATGHTQSDLSQTGLATQSSLGFQFIPHPLLTHHLTSNSAPSSDADDDDDSCSDSSSDSELSSERAGQRHLYVQSLARQTTGVSQQTTAQPRLPYQLFAPENSKSHRKKRKSSQPGSSTTKKHKVSTHVSNMPLHDSALSGGQGEALALASGAVQLSLEGGSPPSSLLVSIPLVDWRVPDSTQQQIPKPKATVEPYNVRVTSKAPNRRNTTDTMTDVDEVQSGSRFSRLQNDEYGAGPVHDYDGSRGERSRVHTGVRWEREGSRDHRAYGSSSRMSGRGHGWERDHHRGSGGEEYWSGTSHYESSRGESQRGGGRSYPRADRKRDPDFFMQEARRRKKDADKIMVSGQTCEMWL